MTRGTFGNIRLKNQIVPGVEGGYTLHLPDGTQESIFDAAAQYKSEGVPLIVLAGKEYGTGSSRDWAAKGPLLLGVKAVIAETFERIHRSNLLGMGILPLQFKGGENVAALGLSGHETYEIEGIRELKPNGDVKVTALSDDNKETVFWATVRLNTAQDVDIYRQGGILPAVIREIALKRAGLTGSFFQSWGSENLRPAR